LLKAARQLAPVHGLRPHTYVALFGLLWSTGLRISEALNLRRDDVDWQGGILTVKQAKFHKSRLVPLHPSAIKALRRYAKRRDERHPLTQTNLFFLSETGGPLTYVAVGRTFQKLRKILQVPAGQRRPRLHDFRHSFACERLLAWYREGVDVNHAITTLATYLGHGQVTDTYWYLTATPELLAVATSRLSRSKSGKGGQQ
jgi:integrase